VIFVDSSVWIDWLRGTTTHQTETLAQMMVSQHVLVGDLVLVEVLQGIADPVQFERTRAVLLERRIVTVAGADIAVQAARNHRRLRAAGVTPRKTIDTLIATRCIFEGWSLLTRDRDFAPFAAHCGLHLLG
jgi:hypothetical protein